MAQPILGTESAANPPLLLYSTNTFMKFRVQDLYRGFHHVWCSPTFEGATVGKYAIGAGQPSSSDPATIYRSLHKAVKDCDEHDEKIASQKKVLSALALEWHSEGAISDDDRDEIVAMVSRASFPEWRPLIFVIPSVAIMDRLKLVDRSRRASSEPEYIVPDLKRNEFDIIEP